MMIEAKRRRRVPSPRPITKPHGPKRRSVWDSTEAFDRVVDKSSGAQRLGPSPVDRFARPLSKGARAVEQKPHMWWCGSIRACAKLARSLKTAKASTWDDGRTPTACACCCAGHSAAQHTGTVIWNRPNPQSSYESPPPLSQSNRTGPHQSAARQASTTFIPSSPSPRQHTTPPAEANVGLAQLPGQRRGRGCGGGAGAAEAAGGEIEGGACPCLRL